MQIYADVTGREFAVAASQQTPALGSAMCGAVAAGADLGGFESIAQAPSSGPPETSATSRTAKRRRTTRSMPNTAAYTTSSVAARTMR